LAVGEDSNVIEWIERLVGPEYWAADLSPHTNDPNGDETGEQMPTKTAELVPPDDITGELLDEWHRIEHSVASLGHPIKHADRSILATYCRTWAVNRSAYRHIQRYGAVVKWPNGMPGPSPFYKSFAETTKLLRGLLADLGATPAARDFDIRPVTESKEETDELEI
jgi:P27 family predicted phage terminase small subunit